MALALHNRGKSAIVGIDECAVREFLPLREACGLCADGRMGTHGGGERIGEPLTLGLPQRCGLFQALLGLLAKRVDGCTKGKKPLVGGSNPLDENMAVAAPAAPKASHDFLELLSKVVGVALERGRARAALPAQGVNDR